MCVGLECPFLHCVYHPLGDTCPSYKGSFGDLRPHLCNANSNMLLGIPVPLGFVLLVLAFLSLVTPFWEV